jgi:hypothetical protein
MTESFKPRPTDANMSAYKDQAEYLAEEYPGEFVAFCRGEFAGHDLDMEMLIDYIVGNYPGEPLFITKAELELPPAGFRPQRRISRA